MVKDGQFIHQVGLSNSLVRNPYPNDGEKRTKARNRCFIQPRSMCRTELFTLIELLIWGVLLSIHLNSLIISQYYLGTGRRRSLDTSQTLANVPLFLWCRPPSSKYTATDSNTTQIICCFSRSEDEHITYNQNVSWQAPPLLPSFRKADLMLFMLQLSRLGLLLYAFFILFFWKALTKSRINLVLLIVVISCTNTSTCKGINKRGCRIHEWSHGRLGNGGKGLR